MTENPFRSVLFAPGNRAEMLAKLPNSQPDAAVIDLEDATPENQKLESRAIARNAISNLTKLHPNLPLFVRINPVSTSFFADDVIEGLRPELTGVVVPKLASEEEITTVVEAIEAAGCGHLAIMAGIETVAGVVEARVVTAHPRVAWCYFGAEDYIVDLGGTRTTGNHEVAVARAQVAQAARLGRVHAIDMVVTDFNDDSRFLKELEEARSLGFTGKLCIHPNQVPLAHKGFSPSEEELVWASRVINAWETAIAQGRASIQVDGAMVDEPIAQRAKHYLSMVNTRDNTKD